jgi:ABC-type lipoprotein export system ATPase subunit
MEVKVTQAHVPGLFTIRDLKVRSGEKVLIQGPSGLGKTTLLHLIGGILRPSSGEVKVDNIHLYDLDDRELSQFRRHRIGLIYQKLNLIEHLSVRENLELLKSGQDSASLLKQLGLETSANKWASVLSLGEQQRVAVGRVLLQKPDLILADEPTSSLDRPNAETIMKLLVQAAQGKTLIAVSHDERVEKYFDRVIDLQDILTTDPKGISVKNPRGSV